MVQYTNAYSLSPAVKTWLANSGRPRILHVFDSACNLINEHGDVLSIVLKQIGNGPFNLVIEDKVLFSECLNRGSRITIHANQLDLVKLVVNLRDGELWNPSPDWERIHAKRDVIFTQLTELQVTHSLKRSCFDMQFEDRPKPFNLPDLPPAKSLTTSLCIAIVAADISSVQKIAPNLAGLGIGLTPASDDFITGALYAAWIVHSREVANAIAQETANIVAPLTTSLSAGWLRSAGKGEAGSLWHELFHALLVKDRAQTRGTLEKILAVGATSGADALMGFIATLTCWAEMTPPKTL